MDKISERLKFETRAVRERMETTAYREHSSTVYLTSSFMFDSAEHGAQIFKGEVDDLLYSRFSNPNTDEFTAKLCAMEQCETGIATASGMAAVYVSLIAHLQQGDHVLAAKEIFGNSRYIIGEIFPKMGISHTFVPVDDMEAWESNIQSNTKLIFIESPSNPTLKLADLEKLNRLCKENNILYIVDNCFATPYLQQPIKFGADLIIHSATKFIDGQGRVLGGAILGDSKHVAPCYDFLRRTGASLSPFNAWVLSKSLETLAVRMDRHCSNAMKIADYLYQHKEISKVYYPYHPSHAQFNLAQKQMSQGGGLVGFELKGGLDKGQRFLNKLKIHSLTANLGDTRSIATHPASTTHSKLSPSEQAEVSITPGFVRLSVGLEHIDDLIFDIEQALQ